MPRLLLQVGHAHLPAAVTAHRAMLDTGALAAHGAGLELIACEHRHRLERARDTMARTYHAMRPVGAPQML